MTSQTDTFVFVGTYTTPAPFLGGTPAEGIYTYRLAPSSGALTYLSHVKGIDNPSFLALHPSGRHLYAVSERFEPHEGLLYSYAIEAATGALGPLNVQPTAGTGPCYVALDATGNCALVANYGSGSATLFPLDDDRGLRPASHSAQHAGSGPDPERQEGPHAHCAVVDPTNTYLFVADLGLDKIMSYRLDLARGQFTPNALPWLEMDPASGPRHLVFHPNGARAYVINELNSTITALSYDAARGAFQELQTISALPQDYDGQSYAADIHVAPSGKFLYASNRGHDSIAIFAVDGPTGRLSPLAHQSTQGRTPRNFAIDPSGTWLLAANQDSDTIVTFHLDQHTGALSPSGQIAQVPMPVCIKMIPVHRTR